MSIIIVSTKDFSDDDLLSGDKEGYGRPNSSSSSSSEEKKDKESAEVELLVVVYEDENSDDDDTDDDDNDDEGEEKPVSMIFPGPLAADSATREPI